MAVTQKEEILKKNIDNLILKYNQQNLSNNETIVMNNLLKELHQQRYEAENQ